MLTKKEIEYAKLIERISNKNNCYKTMEALKELIKQKEKSKVSQNQKPQITL